jgi:nucleoside-diphosphate-sugar epimerase
MTAAQETARGRIAVVTGGAGAIGTAITNALQETAFAAGMAQRRFGRIVFITSDTFWGPGLRCGCGDDRPGAVRRRRSHHAVVSKGADHAAAS